MKQVLGEVVDITDESTIIINLGAQDNLTEGDEVVIYMEGPMIKDIDGSDLEQLILIKAKFEVFQVQETLSIAKTPTIVESSILNPLILPSWLTGRSYRPKVADKEEISLDLKEFLDSSPDRTVRKGDMVRVWLVKE